MWNSAFFSAFIPPAPAIVPSAVNMIVITFFTPRSLLRPMPMAMAASRTAWPTHGLAISYAV